MALPCPILSVHPRVVKPSEVQGRLERRHVILVNELVLGDDRLGWVRLGALCLTPTSSPFSGLAKKRTTQEVKSLTLKYREAILSTDLELCPCAVSCVTEAPCVCRTQTPLSNDFAVGHFPCLSLFVSNIILRHILPCIVFIEQECRLPSVT